MPEDPTDLMMPPARSARSHTWHPRPAPSSPTSSRRWAALGALLFALFFMLRDGAAISRQLRDLLPFPPDESERLMTDTRDLVIASVGAGLIVAAAQGFIGGAAFWLLVIGAPVFWGVVMAFCSLLPIVGAALVWSGRNRVAAVRRHRSRRDHAARRRVRHQHGR